jgi:hypothetical protein
MTLSIDTTGTEANIRLVGRLNAHDVDVLIRELSALRERMLPAVSLEPEMSAQPKKVADRVIFSARIESNGGCRLWLRDPGLGWIVMDLPIEAIVTLQEGFRQAVSSLPFEAPLVLMFDSDTHPKEDW